MYSVMWSEHCSYKSSKVHLRQFGEKTTDEMREKLLVGIGENAGVVDIGDGWAVTFKVEIHNHPSYVEPYQGAATGVGGIVRDIMSHGRPPDRRDGPAAVRRDRPPRHPARAARRRRRASAATATASACPTSAARSSSTPATRATRSSTPCASASMRIEDIHLAKASGVGNKVDPVRRQDRRRRHRRRLGPRVRDLRRRRPDQAPRRAGRRPVRREGAHRVLPRPVCRARRRRHPGPRRRRAVLRHQRARLQR